LSSKQSQQRQLPIDAFGLKINHFLPRPCIHEVKALPNHPKLIKKKKNNKTRFNLIETENPAQQIYKKTQKRRKISNKDEFFLGFTWQSTLKTCINQCGYSGHRLCRFELPLQLSF
jgi:hypothetical protein